TYTSPSEPPERSSLVIERWHPARLLGTSWACAVRCDSQPKLSRSANTGSMLLEEVVHSLLRAGLQVAVGGVVVGEVLVPEAVQILFIGGEAMSNIGASSEDSALLERDLSIATDPATAHDGGPGG